MLNKIFRLIPDSFYSIFLNRRFRYSTHFMKLESLFSYSPVEKMLNTAMKYVEQSTLEGDYFEFGVFEGHSFVIAYSLAERYRLQAMRFHAFDSFAGLPEVEGIDAQGFRHFEVGQFACDLPTFMHNISRNGLDQRRITVTPGYYDESLNDETKRKLNARKAAIIYIDCDLYESTIAALDFVTEYIQEGTILMFDDWFCYRGNPDRGEQRAFMEWLAKNPSITAVEYQKFDWQGNSFILQRKVAEPYYRSIEGPTEQSEPVFEEVATK